MRNHRKLKAFELADSLVLQVYRGTITFPREEQFGLMSQMRSAAVSTASNIVEGCARDSDADYLRFLDMAYGSACELEYQISVAHRLGFIDAGAHDDLAQAALETCRVLGSLIQTLRGRRD